MKKLISALALLAVVSAHAEIIDHGWYTEDTATGLYWLDFTETRGLIYAEVSAQMGPGQRFDGWRYATVSEGEELIGHFGIPPQGNVCVAPTLYCDAVFSQYAETLEGMISMLGDTDDAWLDSYNATQDVGSTGTGGAFARIARDDDSPVYTTIPQFRATDGEYVLRGYGSPLSDAADDLRSSGQAWSKTGYYQSQPGGNALVRNTEPFIRPGAPGEPAGAINYETIQPVDLNLQFLCTGANGTVSLGLCDGHFIDYIYPDSTANYMLLGLADSFDRSSSPGLRVQSFDYKAITNNSPVMTCVDDGMYVDIGGGKVFPAIVAPAPQGGAWCRATFNADVVFLPGVADHFDFPGVAPVLEIGSTDVSVLFFGWGFDNILVETTQQNISIDFDPWDTANEIRPKSEYLLSVEIKTTSIADGDAYDFDATLIDPLSIVAGPSGAPNVVLTPLSADYDNDGDVDKIVGFRMEDTGISCLDNVLNISGKTLSGEIFLGQDVIVPIECEEVVQIDVDPWNTRNEIRPDDDYMVPVGIMSKSIATGGDGDLDALNIDPATLKFGAGQASVVASPLTGDLNGDSLTDIVYGFNVFDAAIACGDTEVSLEASTYDGLPVVATDSITTLDCEVSSCHP